MNPVVLRLAVVIVVPGERHTHASLGTCTGMVASLGCGLMKVPERLRKPRSITMVVTEVLRRPVLAINR